MLNLINQLGLDYEIDKKWSFLLYSIMGIEQTQGYRTRIKT